MTEAEFHLREEEIRTRIRDVIAEAAEAPREPLWSQGLLLGGFGARV